MTDRQKAKLIKMLQDKMLEQSKHLLEWNQNISSIGKDDIEQFRRNLETIFNITNVVKSDQQNDYPLGHYDETGFHHHKGPGCEPPKSSKND